MVARAGDARLVAYRSGGGRYMVTAWKEMRVRAAAMTRNVDVDWQLNRRFANKAKL